MKLELHIKQQRELKNLTQQKLAEITGLTQQYISLLENGSPGNPTFSTIALISHALDICPYNIFSISCSPCKHKHKCRTE